MGRRALGLSLIGAVHGLHRAPESAVANIKFYCDWLLEQVRSNGKLHAEERFANEPIDNINKFDAAEVVAMAKANMAKLVGSNRLAQTKWRWARYRRLWASGALRKDLWRSHDRSGKR